MMQQSAEYRIELSRSSKGSVFSGDVESSSGYRRSVQVNIIVESRMISSITKLLCSDKDHEGKVACHELGISLNQVPN